MLRSFIIANAHWFALLVGTGALVAHNAYLQPWTLDDAFISFRYAEHFAEGKGLVYNEGERVEGYTTFLWVLLLSAGHAAGLDTVVMAKFLGLAFAAGSLTLLANAHRFIPGLHRSVSIWAVLMLGTCGIFTGWAMSGMEVAMVSFWGLLSILLHMRSKSAPEKKWMPPVVALCCALATMSRPEYGLVFVALFVDQLLASRRDKNLAYLYFGLAFALLYTPYFAWRFSYYGWLLPNTFYAKVGATWAQIERGAAYAIQFCYPAALILAPIGAGVVLGDTVLRKYARVAILPALPIIHAAYVIAVGGDSMPAFRFFSPMMPLVCLVSGMALGALNSRPVRAAAVVAAIMGFNIYQLSTHPALHDRIVGGLIGLRGKEAGLWLKDYATPDAVLATNTAGALAYYSELKVIDMLGLNDEVIAHRRVPSMGRKAAGHEKGDGGYVLSREPDFIQFGSVRGQVRPRFPSDLEIARNPEFKKWYRLRRHRLPGGGRLLLYERMPNPVE